MGKKRLACPSLCGGEVEHIAAVIEVHIILLADLNEVNGVNVGVQGQGQGSFTDDTTGLTEIVDLIEVVGPSGFLRNALQVCLTADFNFHVEIPHFVNFKV